MVMAHLGGKLLLFQSSPPSLGIGKIKVKRRRVREAGRRAGGGRVEGQAEENCCCSRAALLRWALGKSR